MNRYRFLFPHAKNGHLFDNKWVPRIKYTLSSRYGPYINRTNTREGIRTGSHFGYRKLIFNPDISSRTKQQ